MKYTLIADSGCDLYDKDLTSSKIDFYTVPLTIMLGDTEVVDEEDLDTKDLVARMKENKKAPRTACPSPEAFAEKMGKGDNIICVTLSSKVSGTYNSARLAAETVQAEKPDKKIFILDSLSASAGITIILYELKRLIEGGGLTFEQIVEKITAYRDSISIRFLLQDLGNLIKTGRMSKVAGIIAATLVIKPIFMDNAGEIGLCTKCIGTKKALATLSDMPAEKVKELGNDLPLWIAHCFNDEDANTLKELLVSKYGLTNITIRRMRGLASFYANEKGLLMAY